MRVPMFVLCAIAITGCATGTALQPARVLPAGETSASIAAGPVFSPLAPIEYRGLAQPELMLRHAERPNLDVGARLWPFSIGVDLKYEAYRSRWFDVAFNPGLAGHLDPGFLLLELTPRLLVDVNLLREPYEAQSLTFVASATAMGRCHTAGSRSDPQGCYVAQAVSAAFHYGATETLSIYVEGARSGPVLIRERAGLRPFSETWQVVAGALFRFTPTYAAPEPLRVHPFEETEAPAPSPPL